MIMYTWLWVLLGDEGSLAVSPSAGALGKQPDSEHQQIPEPIGTQQQSGNWVHPVQSSEQDGKALAKYMIFFYFVVVFHAWPIIGHN